MSFYYTPSTSFPSYSSYYPYKSPEIHYQYPISRPQSFSSPKSIFLDNSPYIYDRYKGEELRLKQKFSDMHCIIECEQGKGAIFLGNFDSACSIDQIKSNGIKSILTVGTNLTLTYSPVLHGISHEVIEADDHVLFNLSQYFEQSYNFIEKARNKGNILIHCYAGISRSTTILLAYLIKKYKISVDEAFNLVKEIRTIVRPNSGFFHQLQDYQQKINPQYHRKNERNINYFNNYY